MTDDQIKPRQPNRSNTMHQSIQSKLRLVNENRGKVKSRTRVDDANVENIDLIELMPESHKKQIKILKDKHLKAFLGTMEILNMVSRLGLNMGIII